MIRWTAMALAVMGIIHLVVFGADAIPEAQGWIEFMLWTDEHWQPFREQSEAVLTSGAAFWSTVGSCAPPLIILGALIAWMDQRGHPIPPFVGWGLLVWLFTAALIMELSGFIVLVFLALLLTLGIAKAALRSAGSINSNEGA